MIGPAPSLPEMATALQRYLDENAADLAPWKVEPPDFGGKLDVLRALQARLFDDGWARYGWPEEIGGLGGDIRHRMLLIDLLEQNGFPPRHALEHLEILLPPLVRHAGPEIRERLFGPTLRGDVLWCQGFSEPTAGSDLAALKCKATRVAGGYRIDGHKIWTSWAKWADHLFFLARTGTPEDRHRGLTAFVTPIDATGLEVGAIRQSNGHDELAEVFFDGCFVPDVQRIGEEGQGWSIAMDILACERGAYTWLRQCEMLPTLERLSQKPGAEAAVAGLGDALIRMITLRARSRSVVEILAAGEAPGPESSVTKSLVIDTEQHFYTVAREVLDGGIDLGTDEDWPFWQEHYLYSRASSVYGGSQQIQYNVIAKLLINQGGAQPSEDDEAAAVRASVAEAIEQSPEGRAALDGLDWWSYAAAPEDAFARSAFAAWFEEQGLATATSPALAGVAGSAIAGALGAAPSEIALGIRTGDDVLAFGYDAGTRWLAVEEADGKIVAFGAGGLDVEDSDAFDPGLLRRVKAPTGARSVDVDGAAHARATDLARIAAAHEMLGACRGLLAAAIAHTNEREQFGQPLSGFQAIQHILSRTQVELSGLAELCATALEEWGAGDASALAEVVKALAGRAGVEIAQNALQCFGAIGFTEEHVHHLFQKRIHTLDMLLGSYFELRRGLGRRLIETGNAPRGLRIWRPDST